MKGKLLLLLILLSSPLAYAKMDVMVHSPYARATPPTAVTSAVFGEIVNRSDTDRYIVSATTNAAGKVELHDVITEGDVMKMRQVTEFKVPAKGKLELKPGSFHIMLFTLPKPLSEGEEVEVQVTFKNGEQLTFKAPVKKVMSGMKMDHH
ncbi:MAG: copper chaperone PCu(A)C [Vibrio sp.]|uniref:copper chaperone PCu(A)C n=1 Tax=Vibrio sp. TaxID=678 RepID=UPI003A871988